MSCKNCNGLMLVNLIFKIFLFFKNRVKCPFKPFLNETALYAEISGRILGRKTKVTKLIALKFETNIQLIDLKLLSKIHVARPSSVRRILKSGGGQEFQKIWEEQRSE